MSAVIYVYREHGTNAIIRSDKKLVCSERGNDITLVAEETPKASDAPAKPK